MAVLVPSLDGRLVKVDLSRLFFGEIGVKDLISSLTGDHAAADGRAFFERYISPCPSCVASRGQPIPMAHFPVKITYECKGIPSTKIMSLLRRQTVIDRVLPEVHRYTIIILVPL